MREWLEGSDLAGEVRMNRSLDARAVMVVEGATDARLFERFVDHENCYVVAAHDRRRALEALRNLNSASIRGVMAVVDADFGRVTKQLEADRNLLFCDGHDLGIMLISSHAFDLVVAEHASETKLTTFLAGRPQPAILAAILMNSCQSLGALLLLSLRKDLGLKFDDLDFASFVDVSTLDIDVPKMVRSVMNKAQCHDRDLATRLEDEIRETLKGVFEKRDMARGHDCIDLLVFALRSTIGTKKSRTSEGKTANITRESLERELRLAFGDKDFAATHLAEAIAAWEMANSEYKVILRQ